MTRRVVPTVAAVILSVFALVSMSVFALGATVAQRQQTSGDQHFSILVERQTRELEIHVPPSYDGGKPVPVMYMLPGVDTDITEMKAMTAMNAVADQRGFAVVYLQAQPKSFGIVSLRAWNLSHGALTPKSPAYDDLQYIRAAIDFVGGKILIDRNAQYIVGHSEGGLAAQFVAQEIPVFAGFASVKGTRRVTDPWPKSSSVAALIILGRSDDILSPEGGFGNNQDLEKSIIRSNVPLMRESLPLWQKQVWAWANGCSQPRVANDAYYQITDYSCRYAPVREVIVNTGHHWDGQSASVTVANFLLSYRRH